MCGNYTVCMYLMTGGPTCLALHAYIDGQELAAHPALRNYPNRMTDEGLSPTLVGSEERGTSEGVRGRSPLLLNLETARAEEHVGNSMYYWENKLERP
jgi:hypothetical protein